MNEWIRLFSSSLQKKMNKKLEKNRKISKFGGKLRKIYGWQTRLTKFWEDLKRFMIKRPVNAYSAFCVRSNKSTPYHSYAWFKATLLPPNTFLFNIALKYKKTKSKKKKKW